MTEKVVLTKEQAEAVEYFRKTFVENPKTSMSNKTLITALNGNYEVDDDEFNFFHVNDSHHATPEEIAEEKERRWWSARNRDVWELRVRDILKQKSGNELAEVKEVHNSGYLVGKWTCYESKEYIKKHYTVACFAENRLDVKDDE